MNDGPSHQITDRGSISGGAHQLCNRLNIQTQVSGVESNRLIQMPSVCVDLCHDSKPHQKLHHTLQRKSVLGMDTGDSFSACTQMPSRPGVRAAYEFRPRCRPATSSVAPASDGASMKMIANARMERPA